MRKYYGGLTETKQYRGRDLVILQKIWHITSFLTFSKSLKLNAARNLDIK